MNLCVFSGRLTADPQLKKSANSKSVLDFTIAVAGRRKEDEATFVNCQAWEKLAETITQYCHKGDEVKVVGRLSNSNYDGPDGIKRTYTRIIINEFEFGQKAKSEQTSANNVVPSEASALDISSEDLPF